MNVSTIELKHNLEKYLVLASAEDIIITQEGIEIARLTTNHRGRVSLEGVRENLPIFGYGHIASYEEFLRFRDTTDERVEYISGEIYLQASSKTSHQYAVTKLITMFSTYLEGTSCTPFVAPFDIELIRPSTNERNMVQPDLLVICDLEDQLTEDDYYRGTPKLVVEVLLRSTQKQDLILKLDLYMTSGVEEYWIVNPDNKEIMVYQFQSQNIKRYKTYKINETANSFIFDGLEIEVERVFRN